MSHCGLPAVVSFWLSKGPGRPAAYYKTGSLQQEEQEEQEQEEQEEQEEDTAAGRGDTWLHQCE